MAKKKLHMKEIFKEEDNTVIQKDSNTVLLKEKGKKSFNMDKVVLDNLELLAWYFDKTYSEVAEEALRGYLTSKEKDLQKAREFKEEIASRVGR